MALLGAVAASASFGFGPAPPPADDAGPGAGLPPDDDQAEGQGELIDHAETGTAPADPADPDGLPFMLAENEPGAESDPWLDGWKDDEYISTDEDDDPPEPDPEPVTAGTEMDSLRRALGGGSLRL